MTRPRLLFLSQTLPFPPDGGVQIRTYNVLTQLATVFDIVALCFYRSTAMLHQSVESGVAGLRALARVEAFPIPQERSRLRFLQDHLHSAVSRRVYTAFAYRSHEFRTRLVELLTHDDFDLVHADSLDLSDYFPLVRGLPLICVHHDVQSILLRRRAQRQRTPLSRRYIAYQAELMRGEERRWCPQVDLNVTVSDVDRDELHAVAPDARIAVVPNGVDVEYFRPEQEGRACKVVFVGGSSWFPNVDGMQYFGQTILPLIRQGGASPDVLWVGRATARERQAFRNDYAIDTTGYVEDVRPYVREAACCIVPIRVGGGTRIKILDAWAMGKAVVSTSIGCEGLAAADGENILVRDDPRAFAEAVRAILNDEALRNRLGRAGRLTAEQVYSWETIGRSMIAEYLATATSHSERRIPISSSGLRSLSP